jgi:hypothetical protein
MRSPRLKQYAVLYAFSSYDEHGNPKLSAAAEIECRWEDGRREITTPTGTLVEVEAEVFVNQEVTVGSVLWKGRLTALPSTPTALKVVVAYSETPNTKVKHYDRSVLVARYGDTLPTLA